jgi:hypothetical protein
MLAGSNAKLSGCERTAVFARTIMAFPHLESGEKEQAAALPNMVAGTAVVAIIVDRVCFGGGAFAPDGHRWPERAAAGSA